MSPRAASRLDSLGFPRVYDYQAGKADWGSYGFPLEGNADWGSYGFPLEGNADSSTRVASIALQDVPTCSLDEFVADVAARLPEVWDICVVTDDRRIVLGLLGRSALRSDQQTTVESAMTSGPSTIRPSARIEAIRQRMRDQKLTRMIVSRSVGELVGIVRAEDIETESAVTRS